MQNEKVIFYQGEVATGQSRFTFKYTPATSIKAHCFLRDEEEQRYNEKMGVYQVELDAALQKQVPIKRKQEEEVAVSASGKRKSNVVMSAKMR